MRSFRLQNLVGCSWKYQRRAAGGRLIMPTAVADRLQCPGFPTAWTLALNHLDSTGYGPEIRSTGLTAGSFRTWESDVDQPAGAFLMIRRSGWALIGGFDEGFHPVWFEDVDFCYRLSEEVCGLCMCPRRWRVTMADTQPIK